VRTSRFVTAVLIVLVPLLGYGKKPPKKFWKDISQCQSAKFPGNKKDIRFERVNMAMFDSSKISWASSEVDTLLIIDEFNVHSGNAYCAIINSRERHFYKVSKTESSFILERRRPYPEGLIRVLYKLDRGAFEKYSALQHHSIHAATLYVARVIMNGANYSIRCDVFEKPAEL
jgi:hypothetical protein